MKEAKKIYGTKGDTEKPTIIVGDLNAPLCIETEK